MNSTVPLTLSLDAALKQAIAYHLAGRLQEAEQLYRAILQAKPDQPDANHNLGAIACQVGQPAGALPYLKAALATDPINVQYVQSYVEALLAIGRPRDALTSLDGALERGCKMTAAQTLRQKVLTAFRGNQTHVQAATIDLNQLVALFNGGHYAEVEIKTRELLENEPKSGFAWKILGATLQIQGKDSLHAMKMAATLLPDDPDAHSNLGITLRNLGQLEDAVASCRRAVQIKPDFAEAHNNLGIALQDTGKLEEAVASYRRALEIRAGYAEAHNNLGMALGKIGKMEEAVTSYRRALQINPNFAQAYYNLGIAMQELDYQEAAAENYRRALQIKPDYADVYGNLGKALLGLGQVDEAVASYRQARELKSGDAIAHTNLGMALWTTGQHSEAVACFRRALEIKPEYIEAYHSLLMTLQYIPGTSQDRLLELHKGFGEQFEEPLRQYWTAHSNSPVIEKRLKIGYVSGDFRWHSVSYFIESILANHDKTNFEIFCYSNSKQQDSFTSRVIAESDHWIPCFEMSDDQLAQRIRSDGIDILVDLAGHSAMNRLLTFARKPAPVQITYLGYPNSTGLRAMDYRLTDSYTEPDGDRYYTEKLIRLPDSMWCYRPKENMPSVSPLPALVNGYLTFGSFNNFNKISSECIKLWAALLRNLPASRLLMVTVPEGALRDQLKEQFKEHGVAADRIDFFGMLPLPEFQRKLQQVDITLDPFPVNGATTTCESLWLGVPVLTLVGDRFLSRAGLSVLSAAQLPEFAAATSEDFLKMSVLLANDLPRLAELRAHLRERLIRTPLFDQRKFTHDLESIYRDVWREYALQSRTPEIAEVQTSTASQENLQAETLSLTEMNRLAALFHDGRYADMENAALALVKRYPDSGFAWKSLGAALLAQGKDALHTLQRAAVLLPDDADSFNNLGNASLDSGDFVAAAESYQRALALKPDLSAAHCGLGAALRGHGRPDLAVASYRRALEIDSNFSIAHSNLGNALCDCRQLDAAVASLRRALEINPNYAEAFNNLLMVQQFMPGIARQELFAAHQRFGEQFETILKPHWPVHANERDPDKRLKIGYVSGDFRTHPVAYFIEPVLANHDKLQVEVFCYSNSVRQDSVTDRLTVKADHWIHCFNMSDDALAERIRADGIDILVDLSGHTARNRLLVFARKPAPIQITYLGYPGTSGLSAMDYRLTDRYAEPDSDQYYTENLLRLPDSLWCYNPVEGMPEVTPLPALSNGYLTFGSFNNVNKVSNECIDLWAKLLRSVPTARLLMATVPEGEMRTRLTGQFKEQGIAAERIDFCGKLPFQEFQRKLQQVDVTLDPFPVNGATTTCESLWLGVPVLTLVGERFLSRAGLSVLSAACMPEFAAATQGAYIEMARSLADDIPGLAVLRASMRERLKNTPLFDQRRFTRNIEGIYRDVWRKYALS